MMLPHDDRNVYAFKAELIWRNLTDNDKAGVKFGLFPMAVMNAAEGEGYEGQRLCVALMDIARR